jgi:hypothetical protein
MSKVSPEAIALYDACQEIADERIKYSFRGGHATKPGPSPGDDGVGLDCSGAIRWAFHLADLKVKSTRPWLEPDRNITTHDLEHYGEAGHGAYVTVYAIDTAEREHAILGFTIAGRPGRFWSASHKGTFVSFDPYFDTSGYVARRR